MAEASAHPVGAVPFYTSVLHLLKSMRASFLVGGTAAINAYIGSSRPTKDLDLFCRAGDYPHILEAASRRGFKTEVEDERWIAKIKKGRWYCDLIFGSANMVAPVRDEWFVEARPGRILGQSARLLPPTELIWSKAFIEDRNRFDGNDVAHLLLVCHREIDWPRLLRHFDQHWEVLLMHLLRFRYIYPSERDRVPTRVLADLLRRLDDQRKLPPSRKKSCRGRVFSRDDFEIDLEVWGFGDLVGDDRYTGPRPRHKAMKV